MSGAPTLLVVDDEPLNVDLIRRIVEETSLPVRFVVASNGLDALAQARALRPALVLMDLKIPGLDGLEATRRLKADPATRDIPIIALSAHAMAGDREKALATGCDDFDTKPIEFDRLLAKIEQALAARSGG